MFLNGGKAYSAFQGFIAEGLPADVEVVKLPSSSPAHAARTFEEKLQDWRRIADFIPLPNR